MTSETLLTISGVVFPPGSGRGISQTLTPIGGGEILRTVNGDLVDLTRPEFQKFATEITCSDMEAPTLAGIWPGKDVTIGCIKMRWQPVSPAADTVTLIRDPVAGSVLGYSAAGALVALNTGASNGRSLVFVGNVALVGFRPSLVCRVTAWDDNTDEYNASVAWKLSAEEI